MRALAGPYLKWSRWLPSGRAFAPLGRVSDGIPLTALSSYVLWVPGMSLEGRSVVESHAEGVVDREVDEK